MAEQWSNFDTQKKGTEAKFKRGNFSACGNCVDNVSACVHIKQAELKLVVPAEHAAHRRTVVGDALEGKFNGATESSEKHEADEAKQWYMNAHLEFSVDQMNARAIENPAAFIHPKLLGKLQQVKFARTSVCARLLRVIQRIETACMHVETYTVNAETHVYMSACMVTPVHGVHVEPSSETRPALRLLSGHGDHTILAQFGKKGRRSASRHRTWKSSLVSARLP